MRRRTVTKEKPTDTVIEKTFHAGNISIPYVLARSIKSKHIRISIDARGMRVTVPLKTAEKEADDFLKLKSSWIVKHYNMLQATKGTEKARSWETGESVMYKGEEYTIEVLGSIKKRPTVLFDGIKFKVYVNEVLIGQQRNESIENAFRDWFIKRAGEILGERVTYFTGLTGSSCGSIRIKEQKTRWGSCSRKANLNFNWKLVMSPQWVFDYVVLHEVCHLRHLNHSKAFWEMVVRYYPDYKKAHEWLRKNKLQL